MAVRKIIRIDEELCNGCGDCVIDCAEGALKIVDGKARVVRDSYCDGMGACLGACPTGALTIVERDAEAFDEEAVQAHLAAMEASAPAPAPAPRPAPAFEAHGFGGCPGSRARVFEAPAASSGPASPEAAAPRCELTQWPIQLRLVPFDGPIYANRDLVLIADCIPAAYPDVQRGLIRGHTIALSCPKLDDPRPTVEKLARIFQNPLKSVTVAIMEVPCCNGLLSQAQQAMGLAGLRLPIEVLRVGLRGDLLERYTV
jgi:NAD-dependent dihydropyrimidine dehydrogenase PreA subunit